jgi:hypothetical protein
MAKKTRKQKQRTTTRRPAGAAPARPAASTAARPLGASAAPEEEEEAAPSAATVLAGTAPTPGPDTARRRVGRIGPAAPPMAPGGRLQRQPVRSARFGSAAALVEPLDSDDPAIPFDRVPYVPSDLRRVATIAALMVVLILIAWAIVSKVVD